MKTIKTIAAVAAVVAGTAFAAPYQSAGLKTLATTGVANAYAMEIGGVYMDKTGGMPGAFTYNVMTPWMEAANGELMDGEFLAPHYAEAPDGTITIMIAPHLFVNGMVMKGAGPDDNFIVVDTAGMAERFDYSEDATNAVEQTGNVLWNSTVSVYDFAVEYVSNNNMNK